MLPLLDNEPLQQRSHSGPKYPGPVTSTVGRGRQGLVTRARADTVDDHKLAYCHEAEPAADVLAAIQAVKPTVYLDIASIV